MFVKFIDNTIILDLTLQGLEFYLRVNYKTRITIRLNKNEPDDDEFIEMLIIRKLVDLEFYFQIRTFIIDFIIIVNFKHMVVLTLLNLKKEALNN